MQHWAARTSPAHLGQPFHGYRQGRIEVTRRPVCRIVRMMDDSIRGQIPKLPDVNRLWPMPGGQKRGGAQASVYVCMYLFIYYTY